MYTLILGDSQSIGTIFLFSHVQIVLRMAVKCCALRTVNIPYVSHGPLGACKIKARSESESMGELPHSAIECVCALCVNLYWPIDAFITGTSHVLTKR